MRRILIIEDQPKDVKLAADTLTAGGDAEIEARTTASAGRTYLEKALEEKTALPDVIILDLDLGYESGFELLRYWHSTPALQRVQIVVWTNLGHEAQELCRLFGVQRVIPKWEGSEALRRAIQTAVASAS